MINEKVCEFEKEVITSAFKNIPSIYLTASPDTESLQNEYSEEKGNYYELTKEEEWALYLEDLLLPEDQREFKYVPVRSCLYAMNKVLDSIFDASTSYKQDFRSLFTKKLAKNDAKKFVLKTLDKMITAIKNGPSAEFMLGEYDAYVKRGTNINLMIKVPCNKNTNTNDPKVAECIEQLIHDVTFEILTKYSEFENINVLNATLDNNVSQDQANKFFDDHTKDINIILTQQRLIEGTTLYNLDGFAYYTSTGSLPKYKQETGRVANPADGKRFGFIFLFEEDALSVVKMILQNKMDTIIRKTHKSNNGRKLSADDSKMFTRINPAFIIDGNDDLKLIDYNKSILTKSDLERNRIKHSLFDLDHIKSVPGLYDMLKNLLKENNKNTTKTLASNKSIQVIPNSRNSSDKTNKVPTTGIGALVDALMYTYQECIQDNIDASVISDELLALASMNNINKQALKIMYANHEFYDTAMNVIYNAVINDQSTINTEAIDDDRV